MSKNFGAGEIFGHNLATLSAEALRTLATTPRQQQKCPFNSRLKHCAKEGGVCSLREYEEANGMAIPTASPLVTTCPERFSEQGVVFQWVAQELLGTTEPRMIAELPFLRPVNDADEGREVGKIDCVLVHPTASPMRWCALEMQAVYFSGASMTNELAALKKWHSPGLPMPTGRRRPDYRSSGPKRLMPQLQIKVPTLSRWGKRWRWWLTTRFGNHLRQCQRFRMFPTAILFGLLCAMKSAANNSG